MARHQHKKPKLEPIANVKQNSLSDMSLLVQDTMDIVTQSNMLGLGSLNGEQMAGH
jgi:hypothetical protein